MLCHVMSCYVMLCPSSCTYTYIHIPSVVVKCNAALKCYGIWWTTCHVQFTCMDLRMFESFLPDSNFPVVSGLQGASCNIIPVSFADNVTLVCALQTVGYFLGL